MPYPYFLEKKCENCRLFNKSFSVTNPKDMCDNLDRKSMFAFKNAHCELFEPRRSRYSDEELRQTRFDYELQQIYGQKEETKNEQTEM